MLTRTKIISLLLLVIGTLALPAGAARAVDNTRYIGITGNNANPCTLAQPCRTFQRGINMTPEGGELRILDSGFYGNNATINKSLTITGNGNTVYLGAVLTINEADAVVALGGLVLNGQGTISAGVNIAAASAVHSSAASFTIFPAPASKRPAQLGLSCSSSTRFHATTVATVSSLRARLTRA
jgi:hypothetical protein